MVKVIAPVMSLIARGTIADILTFKCGTQVAKKKTKKDLRSDEFNEQQQKFKEAADFWSEEMTAEDKEKWKKMATQDYFDLRCNEQKIPIPFRGIAPLEWIYEKYRQKKLIGPHAYNLFLAYYLTLGPDGWPNYPAPPPPDWKPQREKEDRD